MTVHHQYAAAFARWWGRRKARCVLLLSAAMCFASGQAFSQTTPESTFTDSFSYSPAFINMFGSNAPQVISDIFNNSCLTFTVTAPHELYA